MSRHPVPVPAGLAAEIAAAYAAGETLTALARRHGMHPPKIARIVRGNGGTIRPPHNLGPGTDPAALAAAYAGTRTLDAAAAQFGISRGAARRVLAAAGYRDLALIKYRAAEVRAAYEGGLGVWECARKFGISNSTVAVALRAAGCPARPPGPKPLNAAECAAIRAAYDSGLTLAQCAVKFGHSRGVTYRAIRAAGGTVRKPGPRRPVPGGLS